MPWIYINKFCKNNTENSGIDKNNIYEFRNICMKANIKNAKEASILNYNSAWK